MRVLFFKIKCTAVTMNAFFFAVSAALSSTFEVDPQWLKHIAAAPPGWPKPDWSTVPTYAFCGPGGEDGSSNRLFNETELAFLAGKSDPPRRRPRWYAMGYATLDKYANSSLQMESFAGSQAKQLYVARQIKAIAPDLPVWGGTAWVNQIKPKTIVSIKLQLYL